ncbi:MAG: hypothetical protein IJ039_06525 [Clostridia bacterium]|nr:hypothetical protein [Clostridia bacterium]
MEIFNGLIGNEDIKNALGNAITNSEFLHAYIIEGAYGTGKHTVARLASMGIMCKGKPLCNSDKRCNICQKILNDNCTDVRFFDAFKVDDVRKIKEELYESPTECDYKIYILNNAEKMNVKAQNALLISLEEPPPNVVFFLLCTDATVLLETIRSRAQILRTKPLTNEQIRAYLKSKDISGIDTSSLDEIIISSNGSLGYVLDMLNSSKADSLIKDREKALELAISLLKNDNSTITSLYSMFNMTRDKLKELFGLALIAYRDMAVVKKTKNVSLCFFTSVKEASSIASKYSVSKILYYYSMVEKGIEALNSNSNVPNTLISLITNSKKKGK